MLTLSCDGCRRRIADDDRAAARRLQLGGELVDWCGCCVAIIRAELPRLAAQAREAQRAATDVEPVRSRALRLWDGLAGVPVGMFTGNEPIVVPRA